MAYKKKTPSAKKASSTGGFSAEERAAMRDRARELKAAGKSDGEAEVRAKFAKLSGPERALAERLHTLILAAAPSLTPRTWYGMPAYARDGQVLCFFQSSQQFKTRYATLGFSDKAKLDEGAMWPTSFALQRLTGETEARITALVKRAVG
ncbi:MAG: hypothetical protein AMXMBFR34_38950 [Myxococcaceae bacterium]